MLEKGEQNFDDLSSSEEKPFIGRYHGILRKRKNDPRQLEQKNKPIYKKKRFSAKAQVWMHSVWKIETPLTFNHVYNFHNILAINEHSLLHPDSEESFVSSKFYMKKINSVTIQRQCLFFNLANAPFQSTPIPYLCEKLKSMGDVTYLNLAETVERVHKTLPSITSSLNNSEMMTEEQELKLNQFLEEMASRPFFSQYSPHLLIISNAFLELLGYNFQEFAIESIKHKSIIQEFFSAEHYRQIIHKHLQNIQLMKDYLDGTMTLDQFCVQSMIVCQDYIYTRSNKKIKCNFFAGTSKQLTPFIEIKQPNLAQEEDIERPAIQKEKIQKFKQCYKEKELDLLKKLIDIPKHQDPSFEHKICRYKTLGALEGTSSQNLE